MRLELGFVVTRDTRLGRGTQGESHRFEPLEHLEERARRNVFGQRTVGLRDAPEMRPISGRCAFSHDFHLTARRAAALAAGGASSAAAHAEIYSRRKPWPIPRARSSRVLSPVGLTT